MNPRGLVWLATRHTPHIATVIVIITCYGNFLSKHIVMLPKCESYEIFPYNY